MRSDALKAFSKRAEVRALAGVPKRNALFKALDRPASFDEEVPARSGGATRPCAAQLAGNALDQQGLLCTGECCAIAAADDERTAHALLCSAHGAVRVEEAG